MQSKSDDHGSQVDENGNENELRSYTKKLEETSRKLENEKQVIENEKFRLMHELKNLKSELDRLRTPPLVTGTILEVFENSTALVKSSTGPSFIVTVSSNIDKSLLKLNARVGLNQRSFSIVQVLPSGDDPTARAMELLESPNISYSDIGGLDEQILQIREAVEYPFKNPELFEKVGIQAPSGLLLWGPPGTGKTMLAKAVATETNARFIHVIASEFVQKFIGEGARLIREVFAFAQKKSPAILFIDELDAVGSRRMDVATSGDREVQRTLMQLLSELDGFKDRTGVKVIAATNRPDTLDPALIRPGRLDRAVEVPMPNSEARLQIFKIRARPINVVGDMDFDQLVRLTDKYSGADINNVCTEAGMFAIRDKKESVNMDDFRKAIDIIDKRRLQKERNLIGFM